MQDFLQQFVNGIVLGGVYSLSGTGFAITYGISRILNFAHGIFFAAGAFALYSLTESAGMPVVVGLALSGILVLPLAAVAYVVVIKPFPATRGAAALVGTFGVSLVMVDVFRIFYGTNPLFARRLFRGPPLQFGRVFISKDNLVLTLLAIGVLVAVVVVWHVTGVGRRMRALVQSRDAAMLIGINPEPHRLIAFLWGSGLAGVAGSFFALQTVIDSSTATHATFVAFAVVIAAGLGNVAGAVVVGFAMGVLEAVTTLYIRPEYTVAAPFVVMILVLLLRPQGVFPRKA